MTPAAALAARTSANQGLAARRALLAGLLLLLAVADLPAVEKTVEGLIVPVPSTITTESINRLKSDLLGPLKRFEAGASRQGGKFTVLCDFNPDGKTAECGDFGAAYELARYLRSVQAETRGVSTVAYVHGDVRRHSVLPALACGEIVFSLRARLGQVSSGDRPLPRVEQTAYEDIARGRYPPVLIRKMYDPSAEVLRAGGQIVDGDQKPRPHGEPIAELAGNEVAFYSFALARKLGLCQQVPSANLEEARIAYGLPRSSVTLAIDRRVTWRIVIDGAVTGELVEQTRRRIKRALRAGANLIILDLRCGGGRLDQAHELGLYLARLNEERTENPVRTIAYVTTKARNLATLIALGCQHIVMQKEDAGGDRESTDEDEVLPREARLGGFAYYLDKHDELEAKRKAMSRLPAGDPRRVKIEQEISQRRQELEEELRTALLDVAGRQNYPAALIGAMCSREVRIVAVERTRGGSGRLFLTDQEYQEDQQKDRLYRKVMEVKPWQNQAKFENRYLTLTADQALQLGLAQEVPDFPRLCEQEGVVPAEVRTAEADWLDGLADFLRDPWTSVVLVMLGIVCLILELKMPGVGVPGVIAAICFVLFFWAHSQLHGQITWLAILLFVLGLVLIGLEVFVLPGFGVCGISGIVLVLVSLGLVAYGQWPRNTEEWVGFGQKLSPFGISMLGSLVCVFLIVKYLPHIPILNRLFLKTPEEAAEEGAVPLEHPLHAEYQALLGAIGVAATPLRPAGKTQFGDTFVDVVADGGYIMPGTRVQVIEVEGNRVVVKEV